MIATTASSEITRERILTDLTGAIDAGLTLPSYWYTDPTVYRMEQEAIFRHTWQYAGHASQLQSAGDRLVFRSGCIPIVVVRNDAGELDAFINLCRHRGHELALEGDTKSRKTLQCAYHGWTYNLDGTLRSAPRSTRERDFDKSKVGLLHARVGTWGPLVFVNPDEQGPGLAEQLGDLPQLAESRGLEFSQYELRGRASYEFACNWKILMDNNFECYHCAVAHGSSFAPFYDVDPAAYKIEIFDYTASQTSPIKPGVPDGRPAWGDFRFHYLWPNTFIVDHSIIFNVLQILPLAPDRSAMIFETHVRRGTSEDAVKDYGEFYTNVFMEDGAVVESVQRGHDSGVLPPGPLFLDSEQLLQNFQGLLLRALSNGRSSRNGAR